LSGYRGSAKSTELRRLKQYLENDRYAVVLVDIEDYLNTAAPYGDTPQALRDLAVIEAKFDALDGASRVGSTEIEESDRDCRE
jgi:hypothetical protein